MARPNPSIEYTTREYTMREQELLSSGVKCAPQPACYFIERRDTLGEAHQGSRMHGEVVVHVRRMQVLDVDIRRLELLRVGDPLIAQRVVFRSGDQRGR